MASQNTRGDSIAFKHTGASSHDAAQADPDASLGNHISSTRIVVLDATDMTPDLGSCPMTIERIAGANGTGNGTLTAVDANNVTWTPPGGSAGAQVTIANGETKLIEGNDPDKWIVITRDSATAMSSSATVTIQDPGKNAVGFDDVSTAEQAAGDDEYRCIGLENMNSAAVKNIKVKLTKLGTQRTSDVAQLGASGAGTIQTSGSLADWPDTGWCAVRQSGGTIREYVYYTSRTDSTLTVPAAGREALGSSAAAGAASDTIDAIPGTRLGKEAPSSQPNGTFTDKTGAGEGSDPLVSWSVPIETAEEISIGDLDSGQIYAVWMHREIPAGAAAAVGLVNGWELSFDAG